MWHTCHSHLKIPAQLSVLLLAATIQTIIKTGLWGGGVHWQDCYTVRHTVLPTDVGLRSYKRGSCVGEKNDEGISFLALCL